MVSYRKKVVVIDDSALSQALIASSLKNDESSEIIGVFEGFRDHEKEIYSLNPDVIILDQMLKNEIGTDSIPLIKQNIPSTKIVLVSALSPETDLSIRDALSDSSISYVQKPTSSTSENSIESFSKHLIDSFYYREIFLEEKNIELRPFQLLNCSAIAIAGSTGSPQALLKIFSKLDATLQKIPVFITIHIAQEFIESFARELSEISNLKCIVAKDGDLVQNDVVYIAPANLHLGVKFDLDTNIVINLLDTPPENFCKPAADPMLRSLSKIYRSRLLTIVITGMGFDALNGCIEVVKNGGTVITQNKESSSVFGMAKAVAQEGLSSRMLNIEEIANVIHRYICIY